MQYAIKLLDMEKNKKKKKLLDMEKNKSCATI